MRNNFPSRMCCMIEGRKLKDMQRVKNYGEAKRGKYGFRWGVAITQ